MAAGPEIVIDIKRKWFEALDLTLYRDLGFRVAPSEVVGLVGPSGVGKSTLLRMIAGVDNDYDGTILIDGQPAPSAPPSGFVFQDPRLLPWRTAAGNIRAVQPRLSKDEISGLLAKVDLGGYEAAYPHEMSGGMQRRVGLARALAANPRLLLLDEPFVSLDRLLVVELTQRFADVIEAERPTVLLVSHHPEDAAKLCDRAIILSGRPAGVVADISFTIPRKDRTPIDIVTMVEQMAEAARGEKPKQ